MPIRGPHTRYYALDCYIIARRGTDITFVTTPGHIGDSRKQYSLDLADDDHVDINIWQSPRGFTSVGLDGNNRFVMTGAVWVTDGWREQLASSKDAPAWNVALHDVIVYKDRRTPDRYMRFSVRADGYSLPNNNILTYTNGGHTATLDLSARGDADLHTSYDGLTEAAYNNTGMQTVYVTPSHIDASPAISDPKKPVSYGVLRHYIEYRRFGAVRVAGVPSENGLYVVRAAGDLRTPDAHRFVDLSDRNQVDSQWWNPKDPGFTRLGMKPNGRLRVVGPLWLTEDWLRKHAYPHPLETSDNAKKRITPWTLDSVALKARVYSDGSRYREKKAVEVAEATKNHLKFEYTVRGKGGKKYTLEDTVRWDDRSMIDAHVSEGGGTELKYPVDVGKSGTVYLSREWFQHRRR
jgi:hypothetical protein